MSEAEDFLKLESQYLDPSPEEKAKLAKTRNLADADVLLNYANIVKHLEIPTLGVFVKYTPLRIQDRIEINSIKHKDEEIRNDLRNRRTLFLLVYRANKEFWTQEKVNELPAMFIDAILMEYGQVEDDRFLLPIITRKLSGLTEASLPRKSS
jgi:hypothetical protein